MRIPRRMEAPCVKALVVAGLLGGILVGGSMAFSSAGAAVAPGHSIRVGPRATSTSGTSISPLISHCGEGGPCGGPPGNLPNELDDISCTTSTNCVAVGSYVSTTYNRKTLVESWNDGSVWSVVPSLSPDPASELDGVSCTSSTNCVAVGSYGSAGWPTNRTLVESWNGSVWSVIVSPSPGSTENWLSSVSCTSSTNCVAVGNYGDSSSTHTLVESWNGSVWSVISSPSPGSLHNGLSSVSCTSSTNCVAVGNYGDSSASAHTLVESWNGSVWSVISSPSPGSSYSSLDAVSCTSSMNCTAVGSNNDQINTWHALAESWNGSIWSVVSSPNPGSQSNYFYGVSCTGTTNCVAVGSYANGPLESPVLAESWNGSAWTAVPGPSTGSVNFNVLFGVSCTSSTNCVAVGTYDNGLGSDLTLIEFWNGTSWTIMPSPNVRVLNASVVGMAATPSGNGYWLVDSAGDVTTHGAAVNYGSMGGHALNAPMAHIVATPDGKGYWTVAGDGGIFSFGDATFYGSMGGKPLNAPVVNMAPTTDGRGYWLVASDGGVFSFGDAIFHGSMGGQHLNQPVQGMASTATGGGYWLVASDGGIFSFGDARFYGSMGGNHLNQPVVGMAATTTGGGYWLVASDGGIFTFGNAAFHGSMGGQHLNQPVVGMAADATTGGYWLVASDGGVFSFDAPFYGAG
jgi:hypothetical protein